MKYAYRCIDCGEETVLEYPMGEAPETFYPSGDQNDHRWHRVYQIAGALFKGHGFHRTDYPNSKGRKYAT